MLFENLFFNAERYDLSAVGRLKLNYKLGVDVPLDCMTLTSEDVLEVVRYLIELKNGKGNIDDIDHLGNRRVRAVGELLENQYRIGLVRMERAIKERMSLQEVENLMPHDLINSKPVSAVVKEFFGSSQLSQFMDQTNPLSEVTHKRRLSALGPGVLPASAPASRCATYIRPTTAASARSRPLRVRTSVSSPRSPPTPASTSTASSRRRTGWSKEGSVTDEVRFFSALEEEGHAIAQANAEIDENGRFAADYISARKSGEFVLVGRDELELMDVAPMQLVSVAASLIPFLENDDANRALMGSNMQRQAVPLLRADSPLVGYRHGARRGQ